MDRWSAPETNDFGWCGHGSTVSTAWWCGPVATRSGTASVDVRLTITIQSGARAGQRILLAPEESLRVGRTSKSDIAILDDPTMSGTHFAIEYSGEIPKVRDLGSRNGLFVNGQQVVEAVVQTGDQIRAGRTMFSVLLEGAEPAEVGASPSDQTLRHGPEVPTRADLPPLAWKDAKLPAEAGTVFVGRDVFEGLQHSGETKDAFPPTRGHARDDGQVLAGAELPAEDPTLDASSYRHLLEQRATRRPGQLYAVVDGSIAHALVQEAKNEKLPTETLLSDASSPYLAAVAPYLIEVRPDSGFLLAWRAMVSKNPGILVESQADFGEVLNHVRAIFSRKDERGKQSFFRFYDPNLLYGWLSSCTSPQLAAFFGCLNAVVVGLEAGNRVLRLSYVNEALNTEEILAP